MRGRESANDKSVSSIPHKRKAKVKSSKSASASDSDFGQGEGEGRSKDASYTPSREAIAGRSSKPQEREKCIYRDRSACILLGTANPEACHIIPFAINSTQRSVAEVWDRRRFDCLWPDTPVRRHRLLTGHLGCSDKVWNMISLNRQMHKWWSEAFFALKCLGIIPAQDLSGDATIQLQFHWMPRRAEGQQQTRQTDLKGKGWAGATDASLHWARPVNLNNGEAMKMVNDWKERTQYGTPDILPTGGTVSAADAATCRLLQTGHIVELQMSLEEAENIKAMVELQWACLQIASMSGAAGWNDFLEDPDDDNYGDPVREWLAAQQSPATGARSEASCG